jgi:hypothetical protein
MRGETMELVSNPDRSRSPSSPVKALRLFCSCWFRRARVLSCTWRRRQGALALAIHLHVCCHSHNLDVRRKVEREAQQRIHRREGREGKEAEGVRERERREE